MAATVQSVLTAGQNTVNATNFDTASINVTAGDVIVVVSVTTKGTGTLGFAVVTGLGATWNNIGASLAGTSRRGRMHGTTIPATTSGVVNISLMVAGTPQDADGLAWAVLKLGAAALPETQWKLGTDENTNDPTATLDALAAADSLVLGFFVTNEAGPGGTPNTGWSEHEEQGYSSTLNASQYLYSHAGGITVVAPAVLTGTPGGQLLAVEIPAAPAAAPASHRAAIAAGFHRKRRRRLG